MRVLFIALYAEGETDEHFLPALIRRAAVDILSSRATDLVEVPPPRAINSRLRADVAHAADRILGAARRSVNYDLLVVHADADDRTPDKALEQRFRPGQERVHEASKASQPVCHRLVPIIPVRNTEAWMLADPEALRRVIGAHIDSVLSRLRGDPKAVEGIADPKQDLEQLIRAAVGRRRRRKVSLRDLYEPLADEIGLDRLGRVPAYARFASDLTDALASMGLVG
jgi:hypothetical protein